MEDTEQGLAPVIVVANEEGVEAVYGEYVEFIQKLHVDLEAEYEDLIANKQIPDAMLNGITPVTPQYEEEYKLIKEVEAMISATEDELIPDLDGFDLFTGRKVAVADDYLPAIHIQKPLTDSVDTTAADFEPADYTEAEGVVEFTSTRGITLENGGNEEVSKWRS